MGMSSILIHLESNLPIYSFLSSFHKYFGAPTMVQGKLHLLNFGDRDLPSNKVGKPPTR